MRSAEGDVGRKEECCFARVVFVLCFVVAGGGRVSIKSNQTGGRKSIFFMCDVKKVSCGVGD